MSRKKLLELGKSVMAESIYTLTEADEFNLTVEQEADWIQERLDHPAKTVIVAEIVAEDDGAIIGIIDFSNGHRRRIAHQGDFGMSVAAGYREIGIGPDNYVDSILMGRFVK